MHFPKNHYLHKIFNRNSVKISYSSTKSVKTIINNYNKSIPGTKPSISTSTSNFRNKDACPLNRQCQIREVVYEGTLSSYQPTYEEKKYFCIEEESFKGRLCNHNLSLRNEF